MSINSEIDYITYACNGATTFPFTFKILEADHLRVLLKDNAATIVTVLTNTADYTVYGVGEDTGGNLITNAVYPAGYFLYLKRFPSILQGAVYTENGPFPAKSHETALDKTAMIDQMLQDQIDRCLIFNETSGISDINIDTPVANYYLRFNAAATGIEMAVGTGSYIHPNHSGEVTSVADGAQTITPGSVTLAKMANMATDSLIYRRTAGAGAPEVNSRAQFKTDLALVQADISGLTTAEGPTFDHIHLGTLAGVLKGTAGLVSAITNTTSADYLGGDAAYHTLNQAAVAGLTTADSPTLAGLTLTGNITMPNGGTIGQAAGPLMNFDDTNNFLEVTGCNVGIGTTAPIKPLTLNKNNSGLNIGDGTVLRLQSAAAQYAFSEIGFNYDGASGAKDPIVIGYRNMTGFSGYTKGDFFIATRDVETDTTPLERLTIKADGNVGIGTTAPLSELCINGGLHVGGDSDAGDNNLLVDGTGTITGGFGCNAATAQTAYASGGALAAYVTGAFGLDSDAHMQGLFDLVVKIRAALVANGIMS